jgi:NPCBM-associated, NEW3 domain of alpha-galactosidase/Bacteriocin-protection, YdeI or OmpD-Associated
MHAAGLAEVTRAKTDGRFEAAYAGLASIEVPADLAAALAAEPTAKAMFDIVASQNRWSGDRTCSVIRRAPAMFSATAVSTLRLFWLTQATRRSRPNRGDYCISKPGVGSAFVQQLPPVFAPKRYKPAVKSVTAALNVPTGWTVSAMSSPSSIATIGGGSSASFSWSVTAPTPSVPKVNALTVTAHLVQAGTARSTSDERIVGSIPPLPPSGANQVSDLPFLSSTNAGARSKGTRVWVAARLTTEGQSP